MRTADAIDVAVVGGGPAGAAVAAQVAQAGRSVVVLERAAHWRWRAGGVFASPAAVTALRSLGLDEATIRAACRLIPAMRVETPAGASFRLTYGAEHGGETAVGFDRSRLDPALLDLARSRGAEVRAGCTVNAVDLARGELSFRDSSGIATTLRARTIVGADGIHSMVARAAGVARPTRLEPRIGLTYHLADHGGATVRDARMRILTDGYVGIAPVPGGRVNVGIVLGPSWRPRLKRDGAAATAASIVSAIPSIELDPAGWRTGRRCDEVEGAWPIGHRVARRSGSGESGLEWLLVGDAAGFLDPFTGEGIHRALVSADLASRAILARSADRRAAIGAYERSMRRRFLAKDVVSWLVQAFLARPALFEYAARRIADRDSVRATMSLVMGDLVPATRVLDPRYLAALLAP